MPKCDIAGGRVAGLRLIHTWPSHSQVSLEMKFTLLGLVVRGFGP